MHDSSAIIRLAATALLLTLASSLSAQYVETSSPARLSPGWLTDHFPEQTYEGGISAIWDSLVACCLQSASPSTSHPDVHQGARSCVPASYNEITAFIREIGLQDQNRYGRLAFTIGDLSYWEEQQTPLQRRKLEDLTYKAILEARIADGLPLDLDKGDMEIEKQRWLADTGISRKAWQLDIGCKCPPLPSQGDNGPLLYRANTLTGRVEIYSRHADAALDLGRALRGRPLETEAQLFEAAEALGLRCNHRHNLHIFYYRGNGKHFLDYPDSQTRLAILMAWKATLIAADEQGTTLRDVGDLTALARQLVHQYPSFMR